MSEYRFVYRSRVPAGRVVFTVANGGGLSHRLSLFHLPDDSPPLEERLRAPGGIGLEPLVEMPVLDPGETGGSFAVDLELGGRYAMASTLPGPDGAPEALQGLISEFRAARPLRTTTTTQPS